MNNSNRKAHRLEKMLSPTAQSWRETAGPEAEGFLKDITLDCGWGRLIFAHTFRSNERLAEELSMEQAGKRDIALYVKNPHVVVSLAPHSLFFDPSDTYRLWLSVYQPMTDPTKGFTVRRLQNFKDAEAINNLYLARKMVAIDPEFIWQNRASKIYTYAVAEDNETGEIIGTATGIDHKNVYDDPENGSSLWCLAVDYQASQPSIGTALVEFLAGHFYARGRSFMDVSVLHSNNEAIAMYKKIGFQRIPAFCLKHKNPINEPLFTGPKAKTRLNPYADIIVNEARRRGITANVLDAENGYFSLTWGGKTIVCRESLSELTTAIAMSRCDDKEITSRLLRDADLNVPNQRLAGSKEVNKAFLKKYDSLVVKPARGEQGRGVYVNIKDPVELEQAVDIVGKLSDKVLLEEFRQGEDLRIVVINYQVVAAAVRKPATIKGTGRHTIEELIEKQSRRRAAATGGESRIPLDDETKRCVVEAGYSFGDILQEGRTLKVRNTANLHTGGTIHDVTEEIHPELKTAAEKAARVLDIPVVGLDFIVQDTSFPDYTIIEANERPGLANHEPQPTAERFVDLLFPQTAA